MLLTTNDNNSLASITCNNEMSTALHLDIGNYRLRKFYCTFRDEITGQIIRQQIHDKVPLFDVPDAWLDRGPTVLRTILMALKLKQNQFIGLVCVLSFGLILSIGVPVLFGYRRELAKYIMESCCRKNQTRPTDNINVTIRHTHDNHRQARLTLQPSRTGNRTGRDSRGNYQIIPIN